MRQESGKVLAMTGESHKSIAARFPDLSPDEFPLLAGVDKDSFTMFNRYQLGRVEMELHRLLEDAPPERAKFIQDLIEMCQRFGKGNVQLWFIGD
jgi:hypothetical protein